MEIETIKTMEEFTSYICGLFKQGVPIIGISIDRAFFHKIKPFFIEEDQVETILGLQIVIVESNAWQKHYPKNFKIHTRGRE